MKPRQITQAPLFVAPRPLKNGEQVNATVDLVVQDDDSGSVYRCCGVMWCGAEDWLLLVKRDDVLPPILAFKRCVSRYDVRVVEVAG